MIIGNDFGDKKERVVQLLERILFGKDGPKVIRSGCRSKCEIARFRPQFVPLPLAQTKNDDK
jgi:hypothetical protein